MVSFAIGMVGVQGSSVLLVLLDLLFTSYQIKGTRPITSPVRRRKVSMIECSGLLSRCIHFGDFSTLRGVGLRCTLPAGLLVRSMLTVNRIDSSRVFRQLGAFCSSAALIHLVRSIRTGCPRLRSIRGGLAGKFKGLRGRVPSVVVPVVCARVSTFGRSVILSSDILNVDLSGCVNRSCPLCGHFCCGCRQHAVHPSQVIPSYLIFCLVDRCPFPVSCSHALLSMVVRCNGVGCIMRRLLSCSSSRRTLKCSSLRER